MAERSANTAPSSPATKTGKASVLKSYSDLLQDLSPSTSDDSYTRLLASTVLPKLATAITNAWEPREPEPLLQFLEQWAHLLPCLRAASHSGYPRAAQGEEPQLLCVVSGLYPALNAASLPKEPLRKAGDFKAGQSNVLYVACRSPWPIT